MEKQNAMSEGEEFAYVDDQGNEELFQEVLRFQNPENGKWYICLYPKSQEESEDGAQLVAFAFNEPENEDEDIEFLPIEDDKEWEMVQEVMNTFINDDGNLNL